MSLLSYQANGIVNTNSMSIAEIAEAQSKRSIKKHRKKKDETDGIDTADEERALSDRFAEGFANSDGDNWD